MKRKQMYAGLCLLAVIIVFGGFFTTMRVQADEPNEVRHRLQVTTSQVYFADGDFIAAVQVYDSNSTVPLQAQLTVSLYRDDQNVVEPLSFYTDDDGRAFIEFPLNGVDSGRYDLNLTVVTELGEELFVRPINITADDARQFIIHFDKGLYNPGDDVLFRILAINSATARPVADDVFTVSIFDGNGNRVYREHVQASDFGIISGRFRLADEVNSGVYRMTVEQGRAVVARDSFEVSPFVLPRFEVTLQTDKNAYNIGETVLVTGRAAYFFGEPVSEGRIFAYSNQDDPSINALLDENGTFSFSFTASAAGPFVVRAEVVDNSNYRVETTVTAQVAEGAFEINVMPEHGYLIQGMPNKVYVFTHTADGTPVPAYLQIIGNRFSRQVITNDEGIGYFVLEDVASANAFTVYASFIHDRVQRAFSFPGRRQDLTLSTDRPRYATGETIYLELNAREQGGTFYIYASKNNRLLQMITTRDSHVSLNLGDNFGIIDISAAWVADDNVNIPQNMLTYAHKTVFIDPAHTMQLTVQSSRPEYRPGEAVNMGIGVTDGSGHPLDAALLVSMVDAAMLNLAANDLSICNIRVALGDIRVSRGLDAATLYASLIAGASEQAITRLLLRQSGHRPSIRTDTWWNWWHDVWEEAEAPAMPPMPTPMPEPTADSSGINLNSESDDSAASFEPPSAPQGIETQTARVRRLFLETMLFVPELIARDGHADLDFILADNITTWNIQVVGNTQEGIIGHTQSSIRAFQPFFVEFELPRNSVRYDRVSIPVTVFNYTEQTQTVILTIAEMDWFDLHIDPELQLTIPPNQSQMVYVPITITKFGDFVFRAYADTHHFADASERGIRVNPEGFRVQQVVSSGTIESSIRQHLLFIQADIPDTRRAFISFYPSAMSQVIEGMENIFRMPFGCFEQTSSILYPNILALQYMRQNNIDNPALTQTALEYISAGYQRLLTFEVERERGGFSLYGRAPAETLLTAYGLMQLNNLTDVFEIDTNVLNRMSRFLFDRQNADGTFQITGRNTSRMSDAHLLAFNAYITWALSEVFPDDNRLARSVAYLLSHLDEVDDNYTLALIANILVNTSHPRAGAVVDQLARSAEYSGGAAYITASTRDYFGSYGRMQYLQATALTSLALSKYGAHVGINDLLINYIISRRDAWGTWHSTQATILSLKALTAHAAQAPLEDGQITVTIGGEQRTIDIRRDNTLGNYRVSFSDLARENIMDIHYPNLGRMVYKVVQEFYVPYDSVDLDRGFEVTARMNTHFAVHELAEQDIRIVNTSGDIVNNGLAAVSIPQGFRVERGSLERLIHMDLIERYEMRFDNINLYLRDIEPEEVIDLTITYRPAFPVVITGGHVRVFDYYNPMIEGYAEPMEITVS